MAPISIPTSSRLPSTLRLKATDPVVLKTLNRLSRHSLLTVVFDWLDEPDQALCAPCLSERDAVDYDEINGEYPLASTLEEVRQTYVDLQARKGPKREVVDRVVEGDWRDGLSLYQLAMVDIRYHLYCQPSTLRWSAYRIAPLKMPTTSAEAEEPLKVDKSSLAIPRFHPSAFLQKLQAQVLPDVKAHYSFDSHRSLPLTILRIFVLDSPYNTDLAATNQGGDRLTVGSEASRTIYLAFPDVSPHVYLSTAQSVGQTPAGEFKSLRSLIIDGIPKALSRPRERYTLQSTNLISRNLEGLLDRRGPGNANAAGGGWGIYADPKKHHSPLNTVLPSTSDQGALPRNNKRPVLQVTDPEEQAAKCARMVAQARFGPSAKMDDGKGVERVDIVMEDDFVLDAAPGPGGGEPDNSGMERDQRGGPTGTRTGRRSNLEEILDPQREDDEDDEDEGPLQHLWRPRVRLTFHGAHVFAGIRQLVEAGVIDGERMPGWMTGEEGVTIGAVRHGRIRGHKGSCI